MKTKEKGLLLVRDEEILNELLPNTVLYKCSKCCTEIEADIGSKQDWCPHCECIVFLDKPP